MKAFIGLLGLLVLPSLVLWMGLEIVAPGAYYPVGMALEARAAWVATGPALALTLVMAYAARRGGIALTLMVMAVSFFSIWGGAIGAMTLVNGAFDDSDPQTHTVLVLDRSYWAKSRLRFFKVASWRPGEREVKVWIDSDVFWSNPARVTVTTRSGALGFEWVESVKE
jgi:hypothetical protein